MNIISGTADSLQGIYREQAAYRQKVFIENLG
nr:protein of unknown function [Candidatus Nitrotoga fabula]